MNQYFAPGLLALAVISNALANLAFKKDMQIEDSDVTSIASKIGNVLFGPWFWVGLILSVILLSSYLIAIRSLPLSASYAIVTSSSMALMFIIGVMVGTESMRLSAVLGMVCIALGVVFLTMRPFE